MNYSMNCSQTCNFSYTISFTIFYFLELEFARAFSSRNGFGPTHVIGPTPIHNNDDPNFDKCRRLHELMQSLTAAEEAAIRQITPLISIVRLDHGNLATKGNTSCVWQQSKLNLVLPNLPRECKFVILTRRQRSNDNGNNQSQLKSTKFKRSKIQEALELLSCTVEGVWKTTQTYQLQISQDRLAQWPEEGDLAVMNAGLHIYVDDNEGNEDTTNNITNSNGTTNLDSDGPDFGPAPLQNDMAPLETYEGVMQMNDNSNAQAGNAAMAANEVQNTLHNLRNQQDNQNLPNPTFRNGQETATFQQPDVLDTSNGFANMNKTPYAWARAFPTVFIPIYKQSSNGAWSWVIQHDITGHCGAREKSVSICKWYEYMMWRSDGIPASHPTFSLVLYNHKLKNSLQSQARFVINSTEFDPTTTIEQIREAQDNDIVRVMTEKLVKKAHMHAANIPGTTPYWKSTRHEFKAVNHYNSYMLKKDVSMFHTGSLAEYHEYSLRHLLHKYTAALSNVPQSLSEAILTDDNAFANAVQKYKNVVTHYLASKMEIWMALFMAPVYGVDGGVLSNEFSKSRGAIHFHALLTTILETFSRSMQQLLETFALDIDQAMEDLNSFIKEAFNQMTHKDQFPTRPDKIVDPKKAEPVREEFCLLSVDGTHAWAAYIEAKKLAQQTIDDKLGKLMEIEYGINALHSGNFPQDWVKPGGLSNDNYRQTCDEMQSSRDVLDKQELKKPKFEREEHLFERQSNITNHARTHKCSTYCWKKTSLSQQFDEQLHSAVNAEDRFQAQNGTSMVRVHQHSCRMGYGDKLTFDSSGENNLTRGIPPRKNPCLSFDKNGQPKFIARRNHPRVLQEPYSFPFYGANNDIQHLLVNSSSDSTNDTLGGTTERYDQYQRNLRSAGMGGLEHHNGLHIVEEYVTSYACKGGENSANWEETSRTVTEEYCQRQGNEARTIRSLLGKHMNVITGGMTVTRDQSQFLLGGGLLKRSSQGTPLKCSVNSVELDELGTNDTDENGNPIAGTNFTWKNIVIKYKARPQAEENTNIYQFCVNWQRTPRPPQFFGYHDLATWPLLENYAQWMLTLYKPWRQSIDELKGNDGTFASTLVIFRHDSQFPQTINAKITRAKLKDSAVDMSESDLVQDGENQHTPTSQRRNEAFEDTIGAALSPTTEMHAGDYEDMDDALFRRLDSRIPENYNWSENYTEEAEGWLVSYANNFYAANDDSILRDTNETENGNSLKLFDDDLCRPENCRTDAQKLLVYHHIYHHYRLFLHRTGVNDRPPPSQHVFVEGKPGTGKSFITKTLRNVTRKLCKSNRADMASAPTGCAAALIEGSTHCRCSSIPTGAKFHKAPTDIRNSNSDRVRAMRSSMCQVTSRFMDEHSMAGRPYWAWLKHRHEELRRPVSVLDAECNTVYEDTVNLQPEIYNRPWGGIPLIYSFGDCAQLPPVLMKALYDKQPAKAGTADCHGKLAISSYMNPHSDESESITVLMKDVLRQNDTNFLLLLTHMREGAMTDDDVDFLLNRTIQNLDDAEKTQFQGPRTLHLVPTWKLTHDITFQYLQSLETPLAKMTAKLSTTRTDGVNHCKKETSYPLQNAMCEGAMVMLQKNFVVEHHIMNGSIGIVREIVYKNANGPANSSELPAYVVVEFPNNIMPASDKQFPDKASTWVSIPVATEKCEKYCCTIQAIPLRVCVAITIHKSQGMTIGPEQTFQRAIVYLPEGNSRSPPGLELVAISRATNPKCFAIGNDPQTLSKMFVKKIGKGKAYELRREFEAELTVKAQASMNGIKEHIKALDQNNEMKTYDGGCQFLLSWYHEQCNI